MKDNNVESFVLGTFVGAAVAGLTALLLAPKSGKDLRDDIADQADKTKEQAREYLAIAKTKGSELKETVEQAGSEYMENASATYEQLSSQIGSSANETQANLDEIKEEAKETAQDVKATLKERSKVDKEIAKEAAAEAKATVDEGIEESKDV
ncbi:general stress protein [Alkalibacterium sp. AK22]|uniref:YtxH domain-containing protein n=1 Tax=Alkalibacterium sp. AK22 TaxID=1229520 RepID=UPI0004469377|nr:YtxH domain-containing protein [Alkalibacterium sp. AK22]EXJ23155.1 general stress protein [Alkalibacterium sp. AK22]